MKWINKIPTLLLLALLIGIPPLTAGNIHLALAKTASNNSDASRHFESAAKFLFWQPNLYEQAGLLANDTPTRAIDLLETARLKGALISPSGQVFLGDAYLANGQTAQAIGEWESLFNDKRETQNVSPRLALVYHTQQRFSQEAHVLKQWLEIDPNNPDANERLGRILAATAAIEAEPLLKIAAASSVLAATRLEGLIAALNMPTNNLAYRLARCGQSLAQLDEWALAEQALTRAINTNPEYAYAWAWLGLARQHNGTPDAQKALEYALNLDQQSAAIHAMLGTYWQQAEKPEEARKQYEIATQLEPGNPAWWLALASTAAQSDLSAALNAYIRAVNLAPQEVVYWNALAVFCVEKNAYIEDYGLNAALRAFALDPNNPANMDLLGRAQMATGQNNAAEVMFKKALSASVSSSPVYIYHFHLGLLYLQTNRSTLAKFEFEQTQKFDPQGPYGIQAQKIVERYFP